jgi:16S rRNA (uracil1498-N3)-methyltransferase
VVQDKGNFEKKVTRLQKIADEAVKQCKRDRIPEVSSALDFNGMMWDLAHEDYDAILIPYENKKGYTMKDALRFTDEIRLKRGDNIALVIGPEGGFDDDEIEMIQDEFDRKAQVVTLGKIIMRTETAGIAALSMIMYELEL